MDAIRVISQVATVALIATATRWLFNAKGPSLPATHNGTNVYAIKWQWRAVAAGAIAFWAAFSVWSSLEEHRLDRVAVAIGAPFVLAALWVSSGSVTTDNSGITRKGLLRSCSLRWDQVTEIRIHQKQGGAIELRAGSEKLVADFGLAAFDHLVSQIEDRTRLRGIRMP
jgi:hypothetical protein